MKLNTKFILVYAEMNDVEKNENDEEGKHGDEHDFNYIERWI